MSMRHAEVITCKEFSVTETVYPGIGIIKFVFRCFSVDRSNSVAYPFDLEILA